MNEFFRDLKNNKSMLEGAFRKLKGYFYYNKNMIYIKEKIVDFESNIRMDEVFNEMALYLQHPRKNRKYIELLISQIKFVVIPKSFESDNKHKNSIVSNYIEKNKYISKVNFFIDAPIEIFIFDTLWTVFIGKVVKQENILDDNCYGHLLKNLYKHNIDFESNRLFEPYFAKYINWRNSAFKELEINYNKGKNTLLYSLDIKSYFYNVRFNFNEIDKYLNYSKELKEFNTLTIISKQVYNYYTKLIKEYNYNLSDTRLNESIFPIGLLSSMVLSNIYLSGFDKNILDNKNVLSYGRYVDDILIVYKTEKLIETDTYKILENTLIKDNILKLKKNKKDFLFLNYKNLKIQKDKIKVIYFDNNETNTLIKYYNKNLKIIPSEMNIAPQNILDIPDFESGRM